MKAKILIADDDYDNRAILRAALEAAGFQVLEAADGQEAIAMAIQELPHLIFLDLSMPKISGWEAAKRIRQIPEISRTLIFAFTAHALEGDEVKAKAAGCDDYISKPCVPREVVQKVLSRLKIDKEIKPYGHILVIDDDASNRDMLRARLERAGHKVAEAGNGEEGIQIAQDISPDLIVLDVMMPKMDGWQACRRLKSNIKTKDIPVVLLTARCQHIEELRGWESGADEYLTKPCDHQRLLELIARFLEKGRTPS